MEAINPKHRNRSLDFLRGLAILLVMGRHHPIHAPEAGMLLPIAGVWQRFGWTGVDLFFVLSGFLVGGLLLTELRETGKINLRRFVIRRGFKIWPLYYLYLTFLFILFIATGATWQRSGGAILSSILHLQNYFEPPRAHLWSLAVEEHFYLLLPILLLVLAQFGRINSKSVRFFPTLVGTVLVASLLLRIAVASTGPFSFMRNFYPTHLRLDALLFGVLLAYLYQFRPAVSVWAAQHFVLLIVTGFVLLTPMMALKLETSPFVYTAGYTLLLLGYGSMLLGLIAAPETTKISRIIHSRPAAVVCWIGVISYPVYLIHLDVGVHPVEAFLHGHAFLESHAALRWIAATTVYLTFAIGAGWLVSMCIERPLLSVRDRFFPARKRSGQSQSNRATRPREATVAMIAEPIAQ